MFVIKYVVKLGCNLGWIFYFKMLSNFNLILKYMVFPAYCVPWSVYHVYAWCHGCRYAQSPEKGIRFPELELQVAVSPLI